MSRPLASLRRWVRPANLYHYIHKLESWNKLGELVIFGKLGELENFTKLVIFTNALPSWNNEKTQPCRLGLIQEHPYESIHKPARKLSLTFYK